MWTLSQRIYIPNPLDIPEFWKHNTNRFLNLSVVATEAIWMPVVSVDVGRSFSQYKQILNDRRESLSTANTKKLTMMYNNGDIMK